MWRSARQRSWRGTGLGKAGSRVDALTSRGLEQRHLLLASSWSYSNRTKNRFWGLYQSSLSILLGTPWETPHFWKKSCHSKTFSWTSKSRGNFQGFYSQVQRPSISYINFLGKRLLRSFEARLI
eukprot:jgi/Botrbrau1/23250/Bobra.0657s0001.1